MAFLFVNLFNSHKDKRQIDHGIGKIWIFMDINGASCKNINKASKKCGLFGILAVKAVNAECDTRQINAEKDQNLI